jgi:hypothetical protein
MEPTSLGGQHGSPIGDSTTHHKSPWDFSVALERASRLFDPDGAGDHEPAFVAFEREREAAAGRGGRSVLKTKRTDGLSLDRLPGPETAALSLLGRTQELKMPIHASKWPPIHQSVSGPARRFGGVLPGRIVPWTKWKTRNL